MRYIDGGRREGGTIRPLTGLASQTVGAAAAAAASPVLTHVLVGARSDGAAAAAAPASVLATILYFQIRRLFKLRFPQDTKVGFTRAPRSLEGRSELQKGIQYLCISVSFSWWSHPFSIAASFAFFCPISSLVLTLKPYYRRQRARSGNQSAAVK